MSPRMGQSQVEHSPGDHHRQGLLPSRIGITRTRSKFSLQAKPNHTDATFDAVGFGGFDEMEAKP
jgi:hypothetical protein